MADTLAMLVGALLSAAMELVPGVSEWYERQDGRGKRLVMVGLLTLATIGIYGTSCIPRLAALVPPEFLVSCGQTGLDELIRSFFLAMASNQATYTFVFQKTVHQNAVGS